jgi:hypothetical protein
MFSPDGTHVVTAAYDSTARIWDLAHLSGPEQDLSDSLFSIVAPELAAPAIAPRLDLVCDPYRDTTIALSNPGVGPLIISDASITGADPSAFLLPSFSVPHVILPGTGDTVTVRFIPSSSGNKSATLRLHSNAVTAADGITEIALSGHKDSVGFVFSRSPLDFGYVALNAAVEDTVTLINTGTLPLTWSAPIALPPFTILSITPAVMPPGSRSVVRVRFDGSAVRSPFTARYDARDTICGSMHSLDLAATVVTAAVTLDIPDLYAAPGEIVEVPVHIQRSIGLASSSASGLRATLSFDRRLLLPLMPTPFGSVDSTERMIPVTMSAVIPSDSVLQRFWFRAALGPDTVTDLKLTELSAIGDSVVVDGVAGRFHLLVCREGSARTVALGSATALKEVTPNPSQGVTAIEFDLAESGHTTLTLADMVGRTVNVLVNESLLAGGHMVSFDASALPSGLYVCTLSTPTETVSQIISILH